MKQPRVLVLHVKKKWFDQIKAGTKTEEYRVKKPYWDKRLSKEYDALVIMWAYPKFSEMCADNCIDFPYRGCSLKSIIHPEFNNEPVEVYAIRLEKEQL